MGERKGQNFYYPPDFDYKKHKNLNKYHGTHALRERAKKIFARIIVIRGSLSLKNFDYELVEGCTRQEKRFEPTDVDQVNTSDSAFSHKLAADAMFKTEHHEEDKGKATNDEVRMEKIEWVQERLRDDFAANQALRAQFRKEKRELNEKRAKDADLRARCSLSIPLAPEDPNDKRVAEMLLRYRGVNSHDEQQERRNEAAGRRIFPTTSGPSTSNGEQSNLPSAERLKVSIRRNRDRQINDK
ncbi:hypothetical protein OSTOST_13191, partial [Ostertagia ostertagi]